MFKQNTFPKYFYNTDDQPIAVIPATEDDFLSASIYVSKRGAY